MELMVVIAIIILLVGITIAVGRRLRQSASVSHTKVILNVCKSAADAYATKFKPILHYNGTLNPLITSEYIYEDNWDKTTFKMNAPDVTGTGKIDDHIERFVYKAMKYETSRKILTTLNHQQLIDADGDGFLEIRDAFGNMLEYAAFVSHDDNYKGPYQKPDSSTATKGDDNLPVHKHSFFASAGRDGEWGTAEDDDLYSYDQE